MKHFTSTLLLILLVSFKGFSQSKTYVTSGLELIFSWAEISDNNKGESADLRFAPVINIQSFTHLDFSEKFGIYSGLAIRNVGYIYGNYKTPITATNTISTTYEKRFRSYNLGIPVAFKLGNLNKMFLYAGYELEIPLLYKEKTYENGDQLDGMKITGWFSDRQQSVYHSLLVGIQFPYGMNLKFKYYLTEFHNQNYVASDNSKPYAGLLSNVFYISLNSMLFRNASFDPSNKE
ncbi:MAG: hypothetical protein JNK73_04575 [Bacteroidia bacterium]|nr:hypothetical protein [Bacteroidia bacterium]